MAETHVPWWRLFAMQNDDPRKAVGMTVLVAFVAALGVSTAATTLPVAASSVVSLPEWMPTVSCLASGEKNSVR